MSEPKPFASLSSGLLARKGAARPAMRPQGFGQGGGSLEDLGWDDMGFEPPRAAVAPLRDETHDAFGEEFEEQPLRNPLAALTPVQSPVHSQHAEIAERLSDRGEDYSDEGEEEEEADETAELYEAAVSTEAVRPNVETLAAEPVLVEPVAAPIAIAVAAPVRAAAPRRSLTTRAAPGSKARAAFTLRLDPERHMKLRLACAVGGRSAQMLV
ncbi:MAG: hypothetical protein ABIS23_08210, partial [Sphingomicrobium sp.]